MATTKIFRVGTKFGDTLIEHLVRATSGPQAQAHVTNGVITTEVASQEDILRLAQAGTKLQDATVKGPAPAIAPAAPGAKPKATGK